MADHTEPLASLVRKLEYSGRLSDDDRAAVLALPHTLRTIEAQGYIVREGDKPTHSCLLRSGFVFRHKIVGDGARQVCSIHMNGDIVDLQNSLLGYADHSVQALTVSQLAFIPRDAIRRVAFERPAVGLAMWFDTLVDGSIFREWIANIGRRRARPRIAHLLCDFSLRVEAAGLGRHDDYTLPMTQEQLGDCTGLTSVHVNRTLRELGHEGIITRTARTVRVDDWKRLAAVGDFQSAYLHLRPDQLAPVQS